jgi:hypothetical protein
VGKFLQHAGDAEYAVCLVALRCSIELIFTVAGLAGRVARNVTASNSGERMPSATASASTRVAAPQPVGA